MDNLVPSETVRRVTILAELVFFDICDSNENAKKFLKKGKKLIVARAGEKDGKNSKSTKRRKIALTSM